MSHIKNEHLIYAYGELEDGNFVLIVGVTDKGIETLQNKLTLLVDPPRVFPVKNVIIFHEKDKETLKLRLHETGLPIKEGDLRNI